MKNTMNMKQNNYHNLVAQSTIWLVCKFLVFQLHSKSSKTWAVNTKGSQSVHG